MIPFGPIGIRNGWPRGFQLTEQGLQSGLKFVWKSRYLNQLHLFSLTQPAAFPIGCLKGPIPLKLRIDGDNERFWQRIGDRLLRGLIPTAASLEQAQLLADTLAQEQLAACVNRVGPVHSTYLWQGNREDQRVFVDCQNPSNALEAL